MAERHGEELGVLVSTFILDFCSQRCPPPPSPTPLTHIGLL